MKEAKTKCGTIASLLSAAPNLHSNGVLMFKKRRQRDKKYPLVSFGAAARTSAEEEDGLPPTSESELYEEAFSYAHSLTNQSDWDSPYLDTELPGRAQAQQRAGGWEGSGVRPPGEGPTLNSSASAQPPSPSSWPEKVQRPRSMDRACSLHLGHKALRQRRLCSHPALRQPLWPAPDLSSLAVEPLPQFQAYLTVQLGPLLPVYKRSGQVPPL